MLSAVVKVADLTKHSEVNEYLELGWRIIDTYKTAYDTEGPAANHQTLHYVLGWVSGEPKYPERKIDADDPF